MPDISPSIPIAGQPNSSEEPKIVTALGSIVSTINNLDKDNLTASAGILDTQLASPNNGVWRTIRQQPFVIPGGSGSNLYAFAADGTAFVASGGTAKAVPIFNIAPSDFAVAGKTAKARVVAQLLTNTVTPATSFAFGLYPVSGGGGGVANLVVPNLGTVLVTTSIGPTGGAAQAAASGTIDLPSGALLLCCSLGGGLAANTQVSGTIDLQMSHA